MHDKDADAPFLDQAPFKTLGSAAVHAGGGGGGGGVAVPPPVQNGSVGGHAGGGGGPDGFTGGGGGPNGFGGGGGGTLLPHPLYPLFTWPPVVPQSPALSVWAVQDCFITQ